jgi:type IV pilus assembly protein PilA
MNKNKGFSLVELIVVVAIMAVLVGILAPAYLSYVEKTRRGTDENTAEEIRHTVEISAAEIDVYDQLKNGGTLTFSNNSKIIDVTGTTNISVAKLKEALNDVYADKKFETKSKKYSGDNLYVKINAAGTDGGALLVTTNFKR